MDVMELLSNFGIGAEADHGLLNNDVGHDIVGMFSSDEENSGHLDVLAFGFFDFPDEPIPGASSYGGGSPISTPTFSAEFKLPSLESDTTVALAHKGLKRPHEPAGADPVVVPPPPSPVAVAAVKKEKEAQGPPLKRSKRILSKVVPHKQGAPTFKTKADNHSKNKSMSKNELQSKKSSGIEKKMKRVKKETKRAKGGAFECGCLVNANTFCSKECCRVGSSELVVSGLIGDTYYESLPWRWEGHHVEVLLDRLRGLSSGASFHLSVAGSDAQYFVPYYKPTKAIGDKAVFTPVATDAKFVFAGAPIYCFVARQDKTRKIRVFLEPRYSRRKAPKCTVDFRVAWEHKHGTSKIISWGHHMS